MRNNDRQLRDTVKNGKLGNITLDQNIGSMHSKILQIQRRRVGTSEQTLKNSPHHIFGNTPTVNLWVKNFNSNFVEQFGRWCSCGLLTQYLHPILQIAQKNHATKIAVASLQNHVKCDDYSGFRNYMQTKQTGQRKLLARSSNKIQEIELETILQREWTLVRGKKKPYSIEFRVRLLLANSNQLSKLGEASSLFKH
ncbi:hypothetical protein PR048_018065 [Dryococelus australis]|uniref:Uncharacterized protein n=1 Tax=Dryococelus australis TaxID=614101 RepID=A0ABQ9HB84_9NEOP|nr:hypothetical protein PR048_018065 [Dryococelus australis]